MTSSKKTEEYELLPAYTPNDGIETEVEPVYEPEAEQVAAKRNNKRIWRPFFSSICFNVFMVIYGTVLLLNFAFPKININLVTAEVDQSLLVQMHKTIDSLETVMEGLTRNLSSLLPETWPHGYYKAHFRGLCRKNDDSPSVCYYGSNMEDLLVGDIGVQIAEFNGMEDPILFRKGFVQSYNDVKQDLRWELAKRERYTKNTATYDGINARTYNNLPPTANLQSLSQIFYYAHILLSLTMFIVALRGWWNGECVFVVIACFILIATNFSMLPLIFGVWDCWQKLEALFVTVYAGPQLLFEYAAAFAFLMSLFHLPILATKLAEQNYRRTRDNEEAQKNQQMMERDEVSGV